MRTFTRSLLGAALAVSLLPSALNAKPLSATIYLKGGQPLACFIVAFDGASYQYSLDEGGAGAKMLPADQVESVELRTPEGWDEAMASYVGGDYQAAEAAFTVLADDYATIAAMPDGFGARGRYYQLQSLKRNGKYKVLADSVDAVRQNPVALGEYYVGQLGLFQGWAHLGRSEWPQVIEWVAGFEDPAAQGARPRIPFKDLPTPTIAELSFLRGVAKLRTEDREGGLEDLSTTISVSFGSDTSLTKAALVEMLKQFTAVEEDDFVARREAYALALSLKSLSGGIVPPEFSKLLDPPEMPTAEGGAEAAPAPAAEAPAEGEAAEPAEGEEAPAEEAAPEAEEAEAPAPKEKGKKKQK